MKKYAARLMAVLLLLVCLMPFLPLEPGTDALNLEASTVHLNMISMKSPTEVKFYVSGKIYIAEDTGIVFQEGVLYRLTIKNGKITLDGTKGSEVVLEVSTLTTTVHFIACAIDDGYSMLKIYNPTYSGYLGYPGDVTVTVSDGAMALTADLPLEPYIAGVLVGEIGAGKPLEALKAQAVAARTLVAYRGYDVYDTNWTQSYRGYNTGYTNVLKAVEETAGQVMTMNGKLVDGYYGDCNGGQTQTASAKWKETDTYHTVKDDAWDLASSGHKSFSYTFYKPGKGTTDSRSTDQVIASAAKEYGLQTSQITLLGFTAVAGDGRLDGYAEECRCRTGLKLSALLEIPDSTSATGTKQVTYTVSYTYATFRTPYLDDYKLLASLRNVTDVTEDGDKFVLTVRGWGYGLGLSQEGAIYAAQIGKTYREILNFYYTGTSIVTLTVKDPEYPEYPNGVVITQSLSGKKATGYAWQTDTESGLMIYADITGKSPMGVLPVNTPAVAYGTAGDMQEIAWNNKLGYVWSDSVTTDTVSPLAEVAIKGTVKNVSTSLNVRVKANTSSGILGRVTTSDTVQILAKSGSWYRILFDSDTFGYVSGNYITLQESTMHTHKYTLVTGRTDTTHTLSCRCMMAETTKSHSYGSAVETTAATMSNAGVNTKTCTACGYAVTEKTSKRTEPATISITSAKNSTKGVVLTWPAYAGAEKYRVYYRLASATSYTKLGDVKKNTATIPNLTQGESYVFAVRAYEKSTWGSYKAYSYFLSELPSITKAANAANGMTLTWSKVAGATRYRVYYKVVGGTYSKFADVKTNSVTVTGLTSGKKYIFALRPGSASAWGESVGSSTYLYLAQPVISSVKAQSNGITLTWKKVAGATSYQVLTKIGSGKYTKAAETTALNVVLSDIPSGQQVTFAVKAVNGSTVSKAGFSDAFMYLDTPVIKELDNLVNGIRVTWSAVEGAESYRLFYKQAGASAYTEATTTTKTSATVGNLTNGVSYQFALRAEASSWTSSDAVSESFLFIAAPKITSIAQTDTGMQLSWSAVEGATKYRLYYKETGASSYTKLGDVTATTYVFTKLTYGKSYQFAVRSFVDTACSGAYASESRYYLQSPEITAITNTSKGVKVTWGKVTGATSYKVYAKPVGGSYKCYATVTSNAAVLSGLTSGQKYYFTVKAFNGSSASRHKPSAATLVAGCCTVKKLTNQKDGVSITWNAVDGATSYRVYYRLADADKYTKFGDVTGNSTVVTGLKAGKSYVFAVRALVGTVYGPYTASSTFVRLPQMAIQSVTNPSAGKLKVAWTKSSSAGGYQLRYSLSSDFADAKTVTISSNATIEYVISSLTKGNTYYVSLRSVKTVDGVTYAGAWSETAKLKLSK